MTQGWKKTLSIMLCAAMIASGSFLVFAEGQTDEEQTPSVTEDELDGGYQVSEAVVAAAGALEALPELDSLNEQTDADALLAQVQAARAAVEALTEEEKTALSTDAADLLNKLDELEFFFANRPVTAPEDTAVSFLSDTESEETGVPQEESVCKIGETYYKTLEGAIEAAKDGDTIQLTKEVGLKTGYTEDSRYKLWINKSLTIDGQGNTITTSGRGIGIKGGDTEGDTKSVVFKNVTITNSEAEGRAVDTRGGHLSLRLDNATLKTTGIGNTQTLTIGGNHQHHIKVEIVNNSSITAGDAGYAVITFNPVNMIIDHSDLSGYAALYLKEPNSSTGSAGSQITVQNGSVPHSENPHTKESDSSFGTVVFGDNDIKLNVKDSTISCNSTNDCNQVLIGYSSDVTNSNATISGNSTLIATGDDVGFIEKELKDNEIVVEGASSNLSIAQYVSDEFPYEAYSRTGGMYSYHRTYNEAAQQVAAHGGGTVAEIKDDGTTGNKVDIPSGWTPPTPSTPSTPSTPTTPSTGTSSTVQKMEQREKPDPANEKMTEAYNFWQQVKARIRSAKDGKMLKITVNKNAEYMPASVMQTLFEREDVGLTLYWNGKTIVIPAGKAMPKQPLKVYWTVKTLLELYA